MGSVVGVGSVVGLVAPRVGVGEGAVVCELGGAEAEAGVDRWVGGVDAALAEGAAVVSADGREPECR
ncbi:MAG TPA: hypothetical protein VGL02_15075 [Streptomyces sp.]